MLACPDRVRGASVEQQPASGALKRNKPVHPSVVKKKTQAGLGRVEADAYCETPMSRREPFALVV